MSGPATPSVVLVFGNARVEVDAAVASRRGGLRAFTREAEQSLALTPDSYSFFSSFGKVDTYESLQLALASASDGVCTLEIRERPEAKLAREAMRQAAFEARIMAKVDGALAEIQQQVARNNAALCGSVAPLVQNVATEIIDLRAKMELLQAMAMEQIDVRAKLDSVECVNTSQISLLECVATEQIDLRTQLENMSSDAFAARVDSVEGLEELTAKTKEMEEALSFQSDHLARIEALEAQFCSTRASLGSDNAAVLDTVCQQDASVQADLEPSICTKASRKLRTGQDTSFVSSAWTPWAEPLTGGASAIDFDLAGGAVSSTKAMPYSNKAPRNVRLGAPIMEGSDWQPSMMAAPPRGSFRAGRLTGCQSLPLLEAL